MIRAWAIAFMWTLALELPVYLALIPRAGATRLEALRLGLLLNLATHPLFSFWVLTRRPGPAAIVAAEVLIAAVEGELLARALGTRPAAWRAAVAANGFSFLAGLALRAAEVL